MTPGKLSVQIVNWIGLFWFPHNLVFTINNVQDYWGWVLTLLSGSMFFARYKKWMDED